MKNKVFDITKCASTDTTKYFMNGVFYSEGFKVATDGRILAVIKAEYSEALEGKIFKADNTEIDGQFPNYKRVIPDDADLVKTDWPGMELIGAARKMPGHAININGRFLAPKHWAVIYNFAETFGEPEMFIAKNEPEHKAIVFKKNDNMIVVMPCQEPAFTVCEGYFETMQTLTVHVKKNYICEASHNHRALKVTYKQLKDVCPNVLTVGKSDILKHLNPMCTTWGQNGWDVLAYDFGAIIVTAGNGANGVHIPAEIVKKYEAEISRMIAEGAGDIDADEYKDLIDKFIEDAETWLLAKDKAEPQSEPETKADENKAEDFIKDHIKVTGMKIA